MLLVAFYDNYFLNWLAPFYPANKYIIGAHNSELGILFLIYYY